MKDYSFDGSISLEVLNNYLERAMTFDSHLAISSKTNEEMYNQTLRVFKKLVIKYACRFACECLPRANEEAWHPELKRLVDDIHSVDPDVILEACIFETASNHVKTISILPETYKAFGMEGFGRKFDNEKMMYKNGTGSNMFGQGIHLPDITRLETQMFFYQRAVKYIDMGFEALHLGQTSIMTKNDTTNKEWEKLIGMIRDYAREHARRHYVLINSHYVKFYVDGNKQLNDFITYPLRLRVAAGEVDHEITEENPQRAELMYHMYSAVYKENIKGVSPSGWETEHYPYLVEYDNWGFNPAHFNKANSPLWGFDEIGWYAHQPRWYRQKFTKDIVSRIESFNENGHLAIPGVRVVAMMPKTHEYGDYILFNKEFVSEGFDDEDYALEIFNRHGN